MVAEAKQTRQLVGPVIRAWINTGEPSKSDVAILDLLFDELGMLERSQLSYRWADEWVRGIARPIAPSSWTINSIGLQTAQRSAPAKC
jgi:hypothetical protein